MRIVERINSSSEMKEFHSGKSGNYKKEQNCLRDSDIVTFSVDENMLSKNWLIYFESWCAEAKRGNSWKIHNV